MIAIIGDGVIPESRAFHDVRDALNFEQDVILGAHIAQALGIEVKGKVIYNMEPLYDECRSFSVGYLETLRNNHVLDYSKSNVEYLKRVGIEAFHMPYGYHKSLERVKPCDKDIDVLFIGSMNQRRNEILNGFGQKLKFVWARGYYGDDLDKLVGRAKVVLNIHYCESHPLEVVRLNYLMANHCTIVTESGNEDSVNSEYEDGLYFSDKNMLINACIYGMNNPKDGYNCIKRMPHDCTEAQNWLNERAA